MVKDAFPLPEAGLSFQNHYLRTQKQVSFT